MERPWKSFGAIALGVAVLVGGATLGSRVADAKPKTANISSIIR